MLVSLPIGAGARAIAYWNLTKRMTVEIFKFFWQKVSPDLAFPGMQAGDDASYAEWEDEDGYKCQGMRKPGGAKHGIVRTIFGGCIEEGTFHEDKRHGLCFWWTFDGYLAFVARIYDHGEKKAHIWWKSDWSERYSSGDKEMILENNGLSLFKP